VVFKYDWKEIIELDPKGYVEFNNGKRAVHGPIKNISLDRHDNVLIQLEWAARAPLDEHGIPVSDEWKASPSENLIVFPNCSMSYVIETTLDKGRCVRFGKRNILYLEQVSGLDPAKVKGLNAT